MSAKTDETEDQGGGVYPISNCPHLAAVLQQTSLKIDLSKPCSICQTNVENWLCLSCSQVFCSRYVNAHMREHVTNEKHCVCLSFSDISVWCYSCNSYITHATLQPIIKTCQHIKFGPPPEKQDVQELEQALSGLGLNLKTPIIAADGLRPGLVYDPTMTKHEMASGHVECPQRISRIWSALEHENLVAACERIPCRLATRSELLSVHSAQHIATVDSFASMAPEKLSEKAAEYNSIYLNEFSTECAYMSAGSLIELMEQVVQGRVHNGVAVIRPPGHHAEEDKCMGFCIFNNVAIAAKIAVEKLKLKKVLVVDWDVHHGNGTQHMFDEQTEVLYFSIHRYEEGMFFPGTNDGAPETVGIGAGKGFTVNVGWNDRGMGDKEYRKAFEQILLPIALEYQPQLILVSAGFDAARGDPLGGCDVTPKGYAYMTEALLRLAPGKVIIALEGGYNLTSISASMVACLSTILKGPGVNEDVETPEEEDFLAGTRSGKTFGALFRPDIPKSCNATLQRVLAAQKPYWQCFQKDN